MCGTTTPCAPCAQAAAMNAAGATANKDASGKTLSYTLPDGTEVVATEKTNDEAFIRARYMSFAFGILLALGFLAFAFYKQYGIWGKIGFFILGSIVGQAIAALFNSFRNYDK